MAKYISELQVSLNPDEEAMLRQRGYRRINVDLNQGSRDNKTFIWFKRGTEGITDIQLSYHPVMPDFLRSEGYTQIGKNLNPDSSGVPINLWYYKGNLLTDFCIVELAVITDIFNRAPKFSSGWMRMGCDLTRKTTGPKVYLWMRREIKASVCDVPTFLNSRTGVISSECGFNGVYEMTNRRSARLRPRPLERLPYLRQDSERPYIRGELYGTGSANYSGYKTYSAAPLKLIISDVPDSP